QNAFAALDSPPRMPIQEQTPAAGAQERTVAQAGLRSNRNVKIVGTKTFGKGLVHSLQQLSDGSAVMITVGRLRTMEGREILGNGLVPDVSVPQSSASSEIRATMPSDRHLRGAIRLVFQHNRRAR